jgi:hypothetical protein
MASPPALVICRRLERLPFQARDCLCWLFQHQASQCIQVLARTTSLVKHRGIQTDRNLRLYRRFDELVRDHPETAETFQWVNPQRPMCNVTPIYLPENARRPDIRNNNIASNYSRALSWETYLLEDVLLHFDR